MASEPVVDIEELLQALPGDTGAGEDPRGDRSAGSLYSQIKDARNAARAAERAALFDDDGADVMSHWRPVLQLAPRLLQEQAKDLEVACWYLEALLRQHDYAGLRDGVALIEGLVSRFWDGLYPQPDEDGLETRVAPLAGLNGEGGEGTLLAPLRKLPITTPGTFAGAGMDHFNYWHYQQAQETDKLADADARSERRARFGFGLDDVQGAVAASGADFFRHALDDLGSTLEHFGQLQATLRQHCGNEAPPGSAIQSALEELQRALRFLGKDMLDDTDTSAAVQDEPVATDSSAGTATTRAPLATGAPAGREEAFRQLLEIARFFRSTEPHSPLANGIERLVRWGNMNVAELMAELMPDSGARATYSQLTGVSVGEPGSTNHAPASASASQPRQEAKDDDGW